MRERVSEFIEEIELEPKDFLPMLFALAMIAFSWVGSLLWQHFVILA